MTKQCIVCEKPLTIQEEDIYEDSCWEHAPLAPQDEAFLAPFNDDPIEDYDGYDESFERVEDCEQELDFS